MQQDFRQYADEIVSGLAEDQRVESPPKVKPRTAKKAADFGEDNTSFLWFPYFPKGDFSVMMAEGGTGKTILACGIAAYVSSGRQLPGNAPGASPQNVLIISAEDSGEVLKKRLRLSGADLNRVFILDRDDSLNLNFSDGYKEFEATVKAYNPALVIVDPWHAFLGDNVNINRANSVRPVFHKLSHLAKVCGCALILISHVNKRAQGENINNAATGSTDFINASRSAVKVIVDGEDEDCRIMVHTKSNYEHSGKSIRYRIVDGGLKWEGFSDITKATLEAAARMKTTPWDVQQKNDKREALIATLEKSVNQDKPTRYSYDEFKQKYGDYIFGQAQPKRALDDEEVMKRLKADGYSVGFLRFKKNGKPVRGFSIQRIANGTNNQAKE